MKKYVVVCSLLILLLLPACSGKQSTTIRMSSDNCSNLIGLQDSAGNIICGIDTDGWAMCTTYLKPNERYRLMFRC